MISPDVLSTSNGHVASWHDLESVRRLDLDGGVQTSMCLRAIGRRLLAPSFGGLTPSPLELPGITTTGTTLPAATRERLLELTRLEPDWDSYGALPASSRAVAAAGTLISRVIARAGARGVPHEIMPIADGGVSLEWRYPARELGLNACPEGGWSYLLVARDEKGRHFTEGYELSDDDAVALVFQAVGSSFA